MRTLLMTALLTTASASPSVIQAADPHWVYFGCYTGSKEGESKGISRSLLDPATGRLSLPETVAELTNPSFLAVHPNGKTLYAVGEVFADDKKTQGLTAFRMDRKTGALTKLNGLPSGGAGPCHVAVSPDGKTAVVANYGGGSCAFYRLAEDGSLEKQIGFYQHNGPTGPNKGRQEKAHGHCGKFSPDGKTAYVCDLGLDEVKRYAIDGIVKPAGAIKMPAGSGPRHITIQPDAKYAFVNGELDSTVNVVSLPEGKVVQSISTLPGGKPVAGNTTAEVVQHPNGQYVYCSNRGHNSIASFRWDGSKLTALGHITDGIKVPRNFNIDPSGKYMLVANQDGNDVAVFTIGQNGVPQEPFGMSVKVGKPVCVLFVAKE